MKRRLAICDTTDIDAFRPFCEFGSGVAIRSNGRFLGEQPFVHLPGDGRLSASTSRSLISNIQPEVHPLTIAK